MNERVVSLHLLEDVLGWLAVLVGSTLIYFFNWTFIDPLLSICISVFVLYNVYKNMLVSDPEKALAALRNELYTVRIHDVFTLEMDAEPGSMAHILDLFTNEGVSIDYVYAFSFGSKSILVFRTDNCPKALDIINHHQLKSINESDLKATVK